MIDIEKLLREMCSIMSVTGFERRGACELKALLKDHLKTSEGSGCSVDGDGGEKSRGKASADKPSLFDDFYTDPTGTHVLVKKAKNNKDGKRLLLDAHFDEVGMMVSGIGEGGFLSVAFVGGIDRGILPAAEVLIYGKETVHGIVCATPPHLQKPGDSETLPEADGIRIDTGYDREQLEKIVEIGTPVGFYGSGCNTPCGRITGRGFDDKASAAALIAGVLEADAERLCADVYITLSAREEVGGASPSLAAFDIRPHAAFVVDVGFARTPGTKEHETLEYGSGAAVNMSATCDRALARRTLALAREKDIPLGIIAEGTDLGTNAALLQIAMEGIPCVSLSIPLGNMHTYNEALELSDLEALARLVSEIVCDGRIFEREGTV